MSGDLTRAGVLSSGQTFCGSYGVQSRVWGGPRLCDRSRLCCSPHPGLRDRVECGVNNAEKSCRSALCGVGGASSSTIRKDPAFYLNAGSHPQPGANAPLFSLRPSLLPPVVTRDSFIRAPFILLLIVFAGASQKMLQIVIVME